MIVVVVVVVLTVVVQVVLLVVVVLGLYVEKLKIRMKLLAEKLMKNVVL